MVEYTNKAIADLTGIREWIARDNPMLAFEKAELILQTAAIIEASPGIGRNCAGELLYFIKRPWVLVYRPTETGILIHRIFDGREDWRAKLP